MSIYEKTYDPVLIFDYAHTIEPIKLYNINNTKNQSTVQKLRCAAEVHRQTRNMIRNKIKTGVKYYDICKMLENNVINLFGKDDLTAGRGFPTGFSVNNIAAHDSAYPNDNRVVKKDDVIKIDFGTHVDGYIIDSAFTHTSSNKFDNLIAATKEGTWTGIKSAGPDAYIPDISSAIKETIESYSIELNGKTYDIKPIYGLGGHNILRNNVHGGKIILARPDYPKSYLEDHAKCRMKADEIYAIETFASTGTGNISFSNQPITHYMMNQNYEKVDFSLASTKIIYNWIKTNRGTLPFCTRWIYDSLYSKIGERYKLGINELVKNKVITGYPALEDVVGSYTSQMEHTIYLHENGKEILSYGDDY